MRLILAAILLKIAFVSVGQTVPVSIATWKNNAKGAYNLIHDDFGDAGVIGINNYADTMTFNRGIKITFGAITRSCEQNPAMYAKANEMIYQHGHEIINHSHTHSCAVNSANCGGTGDNYAWGEVATQRLNIEVDSSSKSILKNTGIQPRYFIYPYDQFSTNSDNYLKSKGYIGSRTGAYNAAAPASFAPDVDGFFKTALVVDVQNQGGNWISVNHNYWVDQAISNNSWVNREMHNVGPSGWGTISVADYRTHLNYVKQKMTSGDLWVGTVSEILTYQIQKLNYSPTSNYDVANKVITVSWNTPTLNIANYLNPLAFKSPITLNVNVVNVPGVYKVIQNGIEITDWKRSGNTISINVYPHQGNVTLIENTCTTVCIASHPQSVTINEGTSLNLGVSATGVGTLVYQWYKNNQAIVGAQSSTYVVNNVSLVDTGRYYVSVGNGTTNVNSNVAQVKINVQSPFGGTRMVIPGKIEAENFDIGGQNISYNESTTTNEGGATYRTGPVDVEVSTDAGGGYNVGYITNGEWLEYSVNITSAGIYNFQFRIASQNTGQPVGKLSVDLDGTNLVPTTNLAFTGGWQTWQNINVNNVTLPAGDHLLRINAIAGDFNFNYLNTVLITPLSIDNNLDNKPVIEQTIQPYIFPNPANNQLELGGIQQDETFDYKIYDTSLKMIKSGRLDSNNKLIFLDKYNSGLYLLHVHGRYKTFQLPFIKE